MIIELEKMISLIESLINSGNRTCDLNPVSLADVLEAYCEPLSDYTDIYRTSIHFNDGTIGHYIFSNVDAAIATL